MCFATLDRADWSALTMTRQTAAAAPPIIAGAAQPTNVSPSRRDVP